MFIGRILRSLFIMSADVQAAAQALTAAVVDLTAAVTASNALLATANAKIVDLESQLAEAQANASDPADAAVITDAVAQIVADTKTLTG